MAEQYWRRVVSALALGLALSLLYACGGGKDEGGGKSERGSKSAAGLASAQEEAEEARAEAEKAGAAKYAAEEWAKAGEAFDDAVALVEDGEESKAKIKFQSAKRAYQSATRKATSNAKEFASFEKDKAEAEQLQADAKKAGADTLAEDSFKEAVKSFQAALESAKGGKGLMRARNQMRDAKGLFRAALADAESAKEDQQSQAKLKQQAGEERAIMEEKRALAEKLGAALKFATDFGYANDVVRDAERAQEDERWEDAVDLYRQAKTQYLELVERYEAEKKLAESAAAQGTGPQAGPDTDTELSMNEPAAGDTDAEATPAKVDASLGVTALIEANLEKLVSGVASMTDGKVSIDYSDGSLLEKDVWKQSNPSNSTFLKFVYKEAGMKMEFSFWAGGKGFIMLKPVFLRNVSVSCVMAMELVDTGSPYVVAHVLHDGRGGYGSWFGVRAGITNSGLAMTKAAPTTYTKAKGAAKNWVDRTAPFEWALATTWEEGGKSGKLDVSYDNAVVSTYPKVQNETGRVAFSWSRCKFQCKVLRIEGVLDPKWAVEELQNQKVDIPDEILYEVGLKKRPKDAPEETEKDAKEEKKSGADAKEAGGAEVDF